MVACLNDAMVAVSAYPIGTNINIMLLSNLPTVVMPGTITGDCTVVVTVTVTRTRCHCESLLIALPCCNGQ